jgi:prephenate dehydratase
VDGASPPVLASAVCHAMPYPRPSLPSPTFGGLPVPSPAPRRIGGDQTPVRVGFQGETGAFSEEAILQLWGEAIEPVALRTFDDVMHGAEIGSFDYGLLPIESTLVGGLDVAHDLLALHDGLWIVAETVLRIRLSVLGLPGSTIATLRTLASHPLMLAQCAHFLDRHRHLTAEPAWDTAAAARGVAEQGDPTRAAAAGPLAAEQFGLITLAGHIEDRPDTMMRFVVVAPEPAALEPGTLVRTALLCALPNASGALLAMLQPMADLQLNINHFASRPTREPWQYQFFLEFEHDAHDVRASEAINAIRRACTFCRLLGTYPRWPTPPGIQPTRL